MSTDPGPGPDRGRTDLPAAPSAAAEPGRPPLPEGPGGWLRVGVKVLLPVAGWLLVWEQPVFGAGARVYLGAFLLLTAAAVLDLRDRSGREGVAVQVATCALVLAGAADADPALWGASVLLGLGALWSLVGNRLRRPGQAR